jgi:arylsulfatase A-like enzyme
MAKAVQVKRVKRSKWRALLLAVGFCLPSTSAMAQNTRPPNIVFLLCDDLGHGDVGPFGQTKIQTPNIDKLAEQGIKLETHYAGNAVCAPSRCVLLTGLNPGHVWVRDNGHPADYALGEHEGQIPVPEGYLRFPITLHRLGYATGGYGKWGEGSIASTGNPQKQGFDHFYGYICQTVAHNYYPKYLWDDGKQQFLDNPDFDARPRLAPGADPNDPNSYTQFTGKDYSPDLIAAKARQFVLDNKDHPFFLYYATTVPHVSLQVPEDSLKQYLGQFPEVADPGSADYVPVRTPLAAYAAMVTRMDGEVGKIVKEVHDLGLDDNTIFVFTSDNGAPPSFSTHFFNSGSNFRGAKGSMYEGGLREPCIVRWDGKIAPGTSSDRVTGFEDWFPTILELIGSPQETPKDIDGYSFAPTLLGKPQAPRPFLYREMPTRGGEQFVREGKWKAVRFFSGANRRFADATTRPTDLSLDERQRFTRWAKYNPGAPEPTDHAKPGAVELYNLEEDPSEQHDVAAQNPEIVARLTGLLASSHVKNDLFPIKGLGEQGANADGGPQAGLDYKSLLGDPPTQQPSVQQAELKTVLSLQQARTAEQEQWLRYEDHASVFVFSRVLGPEFNGSDLPDTARLMREVSDLSARVTAQAAGLWHRSAPAVLDGRVRPVVETQGEGSYPSAQAVRGMAWATILAQLFPGHRKEVIDFGRQYGQDSVVAGSHYASDVIAGQRLGEEIAHRLLSDDDFRLRLERVKDECQD